MSSRTIEYRWCVQTLNTVVNKYHLQW